jgi:RNA polymerase sigma factor (sigma-70 family)
MCRAPDSHFLLPDLGRENSFTRRGDLACAVDRGKSGSALVTPPVATETGGERRNFATTRWSLILTSTNLGADDQKAHQALSELCWIYWRPIFTFVCRRGHSTQDAQDLTQDFFAMILEGNWLGRADPARGRFRSLLLKSLVNFLNDAAEKRNARKRGGDVEFVSWDEWMAEAPSQLTISMQAESWPAEHLFDLRWAATVVEQAMRRLREECESQGRLRAFEILRSCLGAEREDVSYSALSQTLGAPETTVKRLVHRLRQRYRSLLRDQIADTVADPADVDSEIRNLCRILAANSRETP